MRVSICAWLLSGRSFCVEQVGKVLRYMTDDLVNNIVGKYTSVRFLDHN